MKYFFLLSAFLFFPLLQAQDSGSIEGSVVDNVTGTGIADVTVYFGSDQSPHYETVTDAAGRFRLAGMKDGQYGSHFEKTGYIPKYSGTNDSGLKPVRVAAGRDPVQLRVELVAFATIRGRVVDPDGKPAAKATLTLGLHIETTDGEGRFAFTKLPPATYTLQAVPSPESVSHGTQNPGEDRTEIVPTWFPSAVESDLAEHIVVRGGADLSGYEIQLRTSPVYRVRGVVLAENGKPEMRAVVSTAPNSEQSFGVIFAGSSQRGQNMLKGGPLGYFTVTRSSPMPVFGSGVSTQTKEGVFELPSVPRGTRRFTAWVGSDDGPQLPGGIGAVSTVVDRDIDDLQIRFSTPFVVEASVELAGVAGSNTPPAVQSAFVNLSGRGLMPGDKRSNGSWHFNGVTPGSYRVLAAPGLAGGYYVASVSLGGQDVTGQEVNLQPGSPPIHVVYKANAGNVSGTVESGEGATVVLIPRAALDALNVEFGRVCPSGPGEAFEIDSVGPGSYYAFAVDRLDPEKFFDPRMVRKIVATATVVQVTEGAAVSVKVQVITLDD